MVGKEQQLPSGRLNFEDFMVMMDRLNNRLLPEAVAARQKGIIDKIQNKPVFHAGLLDVSEAKNDDRRGRRVERFENFYYADAGDHYDSILECLDAPSYLSFADACNLPNVE